MLSSTCIISIIRISYLSQRTQSKDIFWTSVTPACWSIVEIHCGVICSCLATLRPLLRTLFPWLHLGGTEPNDITTFELKYKNSDFLAQTVSHDGRRLAAAGVHHGSESTEGFRYEAQRQARNGALKKACEVMGLESYEAYGKP